MHESIVLSFLPPTCIAHTVAILLHDWRAIYDPSSTSLVYAIHHTILVITISCKGQVSTGARVEMGLGLTLPELLGGNDRGVNPW